MHETICRFHLKKKINEGSRRRCDGRKIETCCDKEKGNLKKVYSVKEKVFASHMVCLNVNKVINRIYISAFMV